jgi:excisionase family DNA binding protein
MATTAPPQASIGSPLSYLPRMLTPQEAGGFLNVSSRTVLSWIEQDRIPYVTLPGGTERSQYRIPLSGLVASLSGTFDLAAAVAEGEARVAEMELHTDELRRVAVEAT